MSRIHQYGFEVVREVIPPAEAAVLREEAISLWKNQQQLNPNNLRVGLRHKESGDLVLERLDPVSDISPAFEALVHDQRLTGLASRALGGPVILLKDKLIYKWAGCPGYGLHRDEPYFGISGVPVDDFVSVSLALDPANELNGAIQLFPTLLGKDLAAPADDPRDIAEKEIVGIDPSRPDLNPGDVLVFDGYIPHKSGLNRSGGSRIMLTATYALAEYVDASATYYRKRFELLIAEREPGHAGEFFFL